MTMENHAANDEKSAEHYTGELFGQLMQIDRVHSKEEIEAAVYRLLSLIGEAMDADRVFLFDRLEEEREENYSNTFEWCAEGVSPQIENLERLTRADMPVWLETFERGEPIYIPDLEEVRGVMPAEYDILKAQDIRREIAVPVFYRSTLSGFFGVGNPRGEITPAQIDLLSFVGGHVGSAREKLRMFALLEQKQKTLEQDLQAKLLEQQMLMVLCRNSISVYRVDLMKNRAQIVKVEDYANTADELLPYGDEIFPYYEAIRDYYERFVIKETAPDFLQALQTESLMRALENKDRISRRYRCTPNARGQIYFEVRVSKDDAGTYVPKEEKTTLAPGKFTGIMKAWLAVGIADNEDKGAKYASVTGCQDTIKVDISIEGEDKLQTVQAEFTMDKDTANITVKLSLLPPDGQKSTGTESSAAEDCRMTLKITGKVTTNEVSNANDEKTIEKYTTTINWSGAKITKGIKEANSEQAEG